jgi:hypothetical protein
VACKQERHPLLGYGTVNTMALLSGAFIVRQRLSKNVSMAMDMHAIIEEPLKAVFSMWSIPRLYNNYALVNILSRDIFVSMFIKEVWDAVYRHEYSYSSLYWIQL